jgi:calcineurin-like phosphoesterase family protein
MHAELIARWNKLVKPDDDVFILGDFALGRSEEMKAIIKALAGKKILIKGNHDHKSNHWYKEAGFVEVHDGHGCTWVGKQFVTYSHYPLRLNLWERIQMLFNEPRRLKHMHRMLARHDGWHLHGHVHNRYVQHGKQINVGVDVWWDLLNENDIEKIMKDGPMNYE